MTQPEQIQQLSRHLTQFGVEHMIHLDRCSEHWIVVINWPALKASFPVVRLSNQFLQELDTAQLARDLYVLVQTGRHPYIPERPHPMVVLKGFVSLWMACFQHIELKGRDRRHMARARSRAAMPEMTLPVAVGKKESVKFSMIRFLVMNVDIYFAISQNVMYYCTFDLVEERKQ